MNKPLGTKPETASDTFLKRLGGLTASVSTEEASYGLASKIIAHKAIQRKREKLIEAEDIFYERINQFFRQRKQKGGSGHRDWFKTISRNIGINYNQ